MKKNTSRLSSWKVSSVGVSFNIMLTYIKLCIKFFFITISIEAQNQNIGFEHITVEDGLSNNSCYCTIKDQDGYMWFASEDGLNRWDGYNFKVFRNDPDDSTSISSNKILWITEDAQGILWVSTLYGLNRYDKINENFKSYIFTGRGIDEPNANVIGPIVEDGKDFLWIGTHFGLIHFNKKNGSIRRFLPDSNNAEYFISGYNLISWIVKGQDDELIIRSAGGPLRFDAQSEKFNIIPLPKNNPVNPKLMPIAYAFKLYTDAQNNPWLQLNDGVLYKYDVKLKKLIPQKKFYEITGLTINDQILSIEKDNNGFLWFGTLGKGLYCVDWEGHKFTRYSPQVGNSNSISSNWAFNIYIDETGIIWVSTINTGINKITVQKRKVTSYIYDPYNKSGLQDGDIMDLCEDNNGMLWIASLTQGVSILNTQSGKFTHIPFMTKSSKGTADQRISSLFKDRFGTIWVGTLGLDKYDPKLESFTHFTHDPMDSSSISNSWIISIFEDTDGYLWFGLKGNGLDRFDRKTNIFKHYTYDPDNSNSLINNYVNCINQDGNNTLWVGTENGLCKLSNDKFIRFKHKSGDSLTISGNYIYSIFQDSKNKVWIGTDRGLNLLNAENNSFRSFPEIRILSENKIFGILEDDNYNLWLRSSLGLIRLNPNTKKYSLLNEKDGLKYCRSITYGFRAFYKGRTGEIYYGGWQSLMVFHPDSLHIYRKPPDVILTKLTINYKTVDIGSDSPLKKAINLTDRIILDHDQNILTLHFTALDFLEPKKIQYAYRLKGINTDWVYCGNERVATYTNLDPGNYIFEVKASYNNEDWNNDYRSILIIIAPPWWSTTWAYIIYLLAVLSLIYYTWRLQLRRVRIKHDYEMSRFEADKMHEVDEMKSRFFANISHEFRTPLTLILGLAKKITEKTEDNTSREDARIIRRNANRLNGLVNQLLDLSKLESGNMTLRTSPVNIIPLLKGLVLSFASFAERKRISLNFNSDEEEIVVYADKDKVEKIATNLLSNAFKFTPREGKIEFNVNKSDRNAELAVSDTGIGISPDRLDKIFDRFYQVDSSHTREYEGTGLGLALTKELVELHKGKIRVESKEGKGSRFMVTIPLGKDHLKAEEIIETEEAAEENICEETEEPAEDFMHKIKIKPEVRIRTEAAEDIDDKLLLLIVEDNADVRDYIKGNLETEYRILEAVNGTEGLNQAVSRIPDLIISDVMMPGMNGFEMCDKIKNDERTSHIPIIMLTAKATSKDKIEGYRAGADDYIMKPFEARILRERINNLIRQRERLRDHFRKIGIIEIGNADVTPVDKVFLQKALDIINKHISDETFSVDSFAAEAAMSRSQLRRKLEALVGDAPSDLIRTIRLTKAAGLIEQNFGNISEIAAEVGYKNPANFARSFKVYFGVSPSDYLNSKKQ